MRLGAHVSASGGPAKAIERAQAMGAETIQIFGAAPQSWRRKTYDPAEGETFRTAAEKANVWPVFLHGVYLANLATNKTDNLSKSIEALCHDMKVCNLLGAKGVIFHIGSHRGSGFDAVLSQISESICQILSETPEETWLILENSAGMGGSVGSSFKELGSIISEVQNGRLKVCLDTQHAFAAGYDLATEDGLESTIEEFDREIGLGRLVSVHANDSKCSLGGGIDRHENIGFGHIGTKGFATIMGHSAFSAVPFVLEVPGLDGKGPDKENLDSLKALRGTA